MLSLAPARKYGRGFLWQTGWNAPPAADSKCFPWGNKIPLRIRDRIYKSVYGESTLHLYSAWTKCRLWENSCLPADVYKRQLAKSIYSRRLIKLLKFLSATIMPSAITSIVMRFAIVEKIHIIIYQIDTELPFVLCLLYTSSCQIISDIFTAIFLNVY